MNKEEKSQADNLVKSNSDLEKFAYMVSHDLQGPIRRIASFCEITRDEIEENNLEKASDYLLKIEKICSDASGMIFDILNLCKVSNEDFTRNEVNLNKLIQTSLIPFSGQVDRGEIEIDFGSIGESSIIANLQNIRDVFFNLINNSIKYKNKTAPLKILISSDLSVDNKFVILKIKDNAIGIKDTSSIFEFLSREDSDQNGHGIGLSTCKKIILAHGGEIWCESEPGIGSSFFFTLPKGPC